MAPERLVLLPGRSGSRAVARNPTSACATHGVMSPRLAVRDDLGAHRSDRRALAAPGGQRARPPKPRRKEDSIHIRLTSEQKLTLTEAAERAGLGVSSWLLAVGLRAAQERQGIG